MLEDLGHSAIEAGSGARALDLLETEPDIDIVITDYAMPGMNGSQLAAKIQRMRPGLAGRHRHRLCQYPCRRAALCLASTNPIGSRIWRP